MLKNSSKDNATNELLLQKYDQHHNLQMWKFSENVKNIFDYILAFSQTQILIFKRYSPFKSCFRFKYWKYIAIAS